MEGFNPDEMKTDPSLLQEQDHAIYNLSQENVEDMMRESEGILNLDRDLAMPIVETMAVLPSTCNEPLDYAQVMEENASYERANFTLSTELGNVKEQVVQLSNQNVQLQQQIASSEKEFQERSRLFRQMESSRNELSYKCTGLEAESMKLKGEKEERDNVIKILTREKHDALLENQKLSQELKEIANEKANLAIHIKSLDQEKRVIAFEKEQSARNKALYDESKKWFLKEMVEKDNTIAKLRLEISSSAMKWQNEKMEYAKQVKELKVQLNKVQDLLQIKEESLTKSIASIEERESEHRKEVQNLERELRASKELTELYKDSMDKAEQCAAEFREALMTKESLARSTKVLIEELRSEMEEEKLSYLNDLGSKNDKIRELEDEIEKANEMLKNKHAVSLNLTEDELANLSPAAAETSRFVRGGMTLTSMMREQARLAGELAAERERCQQLEIAMREIVEDIETSAPQLLNQKQQIDKMFDENSLLREQLETADQNRYKLESSKDAAVRELAFTRAELEKFQRDLMDLSRKHQHLLFVMEKERMIRDTNSPPPSEDDDRQMYENIVQLQKRNMQLESELASEKASAGQAQLTAQNTEMEKLKGELETHQSTNTRLSSQLEQMQTAFDTLQEQSQRLSALVEDNVSAAEARAARQKAEDLSAELRAAEMKTTRLEETVAYLKEEKVSSNKTSEEKISAYQASVNELTLTRAKLEAEFEQQKQISLASMKEIELMDKEIKRIQKDYEQLATAEQEANRKLTEMTKEHIEQHDSLGQYKVRCAVLDSEVAQNSLTIGRLEAQLEMFKTKEFTDKGMMESISEISRRLNSIEAEKLVRKEQRMELIEMENNSLKSAASRATAQIASIENEGKVQQFKLEQHISLLGQQLNEKEEQLRLNESQLAELRVRLASVQSQYSSEDSTEDMSPERLKKECQQLKNRTQYLESQCEELKNKLALAEVEVARKEDEMNKLTTHSGKMETGLVEAQKVGELERVRLEKRVQDAEGRADSLSATVGELRKLVDEKSSELLTVNIDRLKEVNELQQNLQVQKQLLASNEEEIKIWKNSVENIKEEMEKKEIRYSKMNEELDSAQSEVLVVQAKVSSLESLLKSEQEACILARETAKIAEDARQNSEVSMLNMTKKIEEDDKTWRELLDRSNSQVADLICKYESVVSKLNTDDMTKMDPEAPEAIMTSQQGVIAFLRDEKDAAFNRAMQSEIEVLRLRSEIKELSVRCDQLLAANQKLSIENVAGNAALADKADLLKKIEDLLGFQQQFVRLRGEKDRLLQVCTENQKRMKEHETEMEKLREQRTHSVNSFMMKEAEASSLAKEVEILKARIETLRKEKTTELSAQVEQLTSKVSQLEKENESLQVHEKNCESYKNKFEQARLLAIKFRDQLNGKKLTAAASGAQNAEAGSAKNEELEKKIEELKKQVNDLNAEKEKFSFDLNVKVKEIEEGEIRLQLLTTQLNKIKAELEKANTHVQELETQNTSLTSRINSSSSSNEPIKDSAYASSSGLNITRVSAAPLFANIPCNPVITTSTISPRSTPTFGKSIISESKPNSTSVSSNTITATSVAGQSNQVSGSIHVIDESIDEVLTAGGGESRDSVTSAPVSSTDVGRKRPAAEFSSDSDIKRQRESPNETVTSSEQAAVPQHIADDSSVALPQDDENSSSQDAAIYPNEDGRFDEGIQNDDVVEVSTDAESDELDDYDGDDHVVALDQDLDFSEPVNQEEDDDVEDEGEEEDEDLHAEADEDDDVDAILGDTEKESRSAPMDQDREAASAMEEADDEERAPSMPRIEEVSASQSVETSNDNRPTRAPIIFNIESDDQCSSSNETSTSTASTTHAVATRGKGRAMGRGAAAQLYQRGKPRGKRGN